MYHNSYHVVSIQISRQFHSSGAVSDYFSVTYFQILKNPLAWFVMPTKAKFAYDSHQLIWHVGSVESSCKIFTFCQSQLLLFAKNPLPLPLDKSVLAKMQLCLQKVLSFQPQYTTNLPQGEAKLCCDKKLALNCIEKGYVFSLEIYVSPCQMQLC